MGILSESNQLEAVLKNFIGLSLPAATVETFYIEPSTISIEVDLPYHKQVIYDRRTFDTEKLGPDLQQLVRELRAQAIIDLGLTAEIAHQVHERVEELKVEWEQAGYRKAIQDLNVTTIKE
ncbi:hypothetical protein SEA_CORN21_10 [Microbacterium phage Corn21]|nr:hypothetical protein SEA_CORN21_10 [Microbacterium phage Corn21]